MSRASGVGHPRVHTPMLDDGEWAGVPIGGLGTGSIGRTFRGDAARWHLEVGQHRFEPVAADGFALFVGPRGRDVAGHRPEHPASRHGPADVGMGPAGGRGHVPRAVPAGVADVRARGAGAPADRRTAVAGHRWRPRRECPARGRLRVVVREPGAGAAHGRAPLHLGRSTRRPDERARTRPAARGRPRRPRRRWCPLRRRTR